jgi:putative spermidine/putrescine transport system ATP-binding protein
VSRVTLTALRKRYGGAVAVDDVSLDVAEGEMVVLLGPSGCGKTTTLRMVAGFVTPDAGDVALDGRSILRAPPHRRDMGLVFQSYALFPHLTVARNIAFGLEMRRERRDAIAARVAEMLRLVKLEGLAERLPRQLSGGQQQRVALARALAIRPRVLLLDEPLSNLDAALRQDVGREIRLLQRAAGLTAIMVTHDQDEAMAMADRLVVMRDGRVRQAGTQEDLYERPADPFVARFIGGSNILAGTRPTPDTMRLDGGAMLRLAAPRAGAGPATLALRPERLALVDGGTAGRGGAVRGTVELSTYLGATVEHVVRIAPDTTLIVRENSHSGARPYPAGADVTIIWDAAAERLFDAQEQPPAPPRAAPAETRETSDA